MGFTARAIGTVAGGGGDRTKVPEVGIVELQDILEKSRGELYLFFLAQNKNPATPEIQRLFIGSKTIFDVIKTISISKGDSRGCKDSAGNSVDGSIISKSNTICIGFLALMGMDRDSARNQVLSLLAHEYSHLLGFNEADATKLQNQIYLLVGQESRESISRFIKDNMFAIGVLRGAIMNHLAIPGVRNWNYYCYMADKLDHDISQLFSSWVIQYSFFDQKQYIQLRTARMRNRALFLKSCGESDYMPGRQEYLLVYNRLFGNDDSILASKFSQHYSDAPVDPVASFIRLKSTADFETELLIIRTFVEENFIRMKEVEKLYRNSSLEY